MILSLMSVSARFNGAVSRDARRLRAVARHPGTCTVDDIELLLRAHGVPEHKIWGAVDRLAAGTVSAPLAWAFAMEYDGTELADVLMASIPERDLTGVEGTQGLGLTGS